MVYIPVLCIKNQISRLCIFHRNLGSVLCLIFCYTGKCVSILCINTLHKTRTVCTFCQTGSSPYIRISDKLTCKFQNGTADFTIWHTGFHRCHRVITRFIFLRFYQLFRCFKIFFSCFFYLGSYNFTVPFICRIRCFFRKQAAYLCL